MNEPVPVTGDMAAVLSTCSVRRPWAEQDEGPYHRDAQPARRDLVEDREGVGLRLGIRLVGEGEGAIEGATVEVWQCDALGRYSGFPPPEPQAVVTSGTASQVEYLPDQTFLRGGQRSDAAGMVEFHTIYPGWYPGRTVHIHLMVHVDGRTLTSQLYFPDDISERVLSLEPYAGRPGRDTTNDTDTIFPTGGEPAVLDVTPVGAGYVAATCLVIPTAATTP